MGGPQVNSREVVSFSDPNEVEDLYFSSRYIEVRTIVVHALIERRGLSAGWKRDFLFDVLIENLTEAKRLSLLIMSPQEAAGECKVQTPGEKRTDHRRIIDLCCGYLLTRYYNRDLKAPIDATDEMAAKLMELIASWESVSNFNLLVEPMKTKIGEFLGSYSKRAAKLLSEHYFFLVIHSGNFNMLSMVDPERVHVALTTYLRGALLNAGASAKGGLHNDAFNVADIFRKEELSWLRPAAQYFVEHLLKTGKFAYAI